jgi:hypothetical protein
MVYRKMKKCPICGKVYVEDADESCISCRDFKISQN